jgi:hypothetical protein
MPIAAMFSSATYLAQFKELLEFNQVDGVLVRDWSEVPIQKWHVLQVGESELEKPYLHNLACLSMM